MIGRLGTGAHGTGVMTPTRDENCTMHTDTLMDSTTMPHSTAVTTRRTPLALLDRRARRGAWIASLPSVYYARLLALYQSRYPKRKIPAPCSPGGEPFQAIDPRKYQTDPVMQDAIADVQARYRRVLRRWSQLKDQYEASIVAAVSASGIPLDAYVDPDLARDTTGASWPALTTVYESTYATQGYRAAQYARQAAERDADPLRLASVPVVVVREVPQHTMSGRTFTTPHYTVRAPLTADGVRLWTYYPRPSLRESVRLCWARGVNPRVYNPFLPHGYEAREGLDYFGHDLQAPVSQAPTTAPALAPVPVLPGGTA